MEFVTVCMWCNGVKANDPLFPIPDDWKPEKHRCCENDCRHWWNEGGCPDADN